MHACKMDKKSEYKLLRYDHIWNELLSVCNVQLGSDTGCKLSSSQKQKNKNNKLSYKYL